MINYAKNVDPNLLDNKLKTKIDNLNFYIKGDILITSGFRTKEHNAEVKGSPTSSHLKGLACDIKCDNSKSRFMILIYAFFAGFRRFGLAKDHIHLDVDKEKPQFCIWLE